MNASMSSETPQTAVSHYRDEAAFPPEERIRRRAYELYVERGSHPSDGVADWLDAEREYFEQP
jgi:hypothetical protein